MRVPPSFTNWAVTPSLAPNFFTRSINAGGKLYSRPQSRPTVFMFVLLSGSCGTASFATPLIHGACSRSARLGDASTRFGNQVPHHCFQVAGFLIGAQLPVRTGAFAHDGVYVFDGAAA